MASVSPITARAVPSSTTGSDAVPDDTLSRTLIREVAQLQEQTASLREEVRALRTQQNEIMAQMNRWRGAVPMLLFIGGAIGTVVTSWGNIMDFFRR